MRLLLIRLLPLTLAVMLFHPSQASAKIVLITSGDTVKTLGEISAGQAPQGLPSGVEVGFKYSYFGIFWIDFWTWGGEYCIHEESSKKYQPISKEQAAQLMGVSPDSFGKPFWYRFPLGLVIIAGIVALFVPLGIIGLMVENRTKKLLNEPAYQQALEIMRAQAEKDAKQHEQWRERLFAAQEKGEPLPPEPQSGDGGLEDALNHLEREGIPRAKAEKNLTALLAHLAKAQQATSC